MVNLGLGILRRVRLEGRGYFRLQLGIELKLIVIKVVCWIQTQSMKSLPGRSGEIRTEHLEPTMRRLPTVGLDCRLCNRKKSRRLKPLVYRRDHR